MMKPSTSPAEPIDERSLVARLLAGEEGAFDLLWREYYPRVFHFSYSLLRHDRDLAEDVTQEVFVHCFEKLHQFRFESKLSTWMMSIAYRKGCRAMRLAGRTISLNEAVPDGEGQSFQDLMVAAGADPRQQTLWRQILDRYREALTQLQESQRSAWVLHREQGLPHETIAAIIGKTPNSCRILVSRARVRLLEIMGGEGLADLALGAGDHQKSEVEKR
jgi:RNA polymerase sigma-70 factor (ECF subfamily)